MQTVRMAKFHLRMVFVGVFNVGVIFQGYTNTCMYPYVCVCVWVREGCLHRSTSRNVTDMCQQVDKFVELTINSVGRLRGIERLSELWMWQKLYVFDVVFRLRWNYSIKQNLASLIRAIWSSSTVWFGLVWNEVNEDEWKTSTLSLSLAKSIAR